MYEKLITFKYFLTRTFSILRHSDAIAPFPGGFGTTDEGYEDIITEPAIHQIEATPEEVEDNDFVHLSGIAFGFSRRGNSRLRKFIDVLNNY